MTKLKLTTKDKALLCALAVVVAVIVTFVLIYWDDCYTLLMDLIKNGTPAAREYIQSFGWVGVILIGFCVILCFFVPILPSALFQLTAGIAYGWWKGTILCVVAFALASQLLWLFRKNILIFSGEKTKQKSEKIRQQIQESKLGIHRAMIVSYAVPFIPFLLISSLAVEGLNYKHYTFYTTLGPVGEVLITILMGEAMLNSSPVASVIAMLFLICVIVLSFAFKQRIINFLFRPREKKVKQPKE